MRRNFTLRVWRPYYGVGYSPLYIYYELLVVLNLLGRLSRYGRLGMLGNIEDCCTYVWYIENYACLNPCKQMRLDSHSSHSRSKQSMHLADSHRLDYVG